MSFRHVGEDGWFDFKDFYSSMIDKFHNYGKFVEIGCWFGKSSCYLLQEIIDRKSNIQVDFVDVKKAVNELFGDLPEQPGHVWCYEK